jgi:hypothetical protein
VKPTVLVATTARWYPTARLAMALANAGFTVDVVCPPGHPVTKTGATRQAYGYYGLAPLNSFRNAIYAAKPEFIISGDDLATWHLHSLYHREKSRGKEKVSICELIERSLGASGSFPVVFARAGFMKVAQQEGVRVPRTEVVRNMADLRSWVDRTGFPTVLKANGTSGGDGVRIVKTFEEAEHAFRTLQAPPLMVRAAKRAFVDHDTTLVWPTLLRCRSVVNAQALVAGREATSLVACWKGSVLGGLHFEVLNKQDSTGPASVIRLIEEADMVAAAEKMVRRLNLSGLHGFDFMLEARTGHAYLIELNPRATQVGHLTLGPGRDLPASLYAAVSGSIVKEAAKVTEKDTIALFPQEWIRNPESSFLQKGFHDVPWEEPELVRACVHRRRHWNARNSHRETFEAFAAAHLPRP